MTLSDEARVRLESDRAAAAKLEAAVSDPASSESEEIRASDFSIDQFFDVDIVQPDPTKVLQPVSAEQQREMGRDAKMAFVSSNVTRNNPAAGAGFQQTVADGSLKIQRADSVPGVNYNTTVTVTDSPYGPVQRNETSFEPSAEIQAQVDAGRALAMWDSRLGNVFLSW